MGALADTSYNGNGDGHVTGPGSGSKSLTLGDSDGVSASNTSPSLINAADIFIANTNDSSSQIAKRLRFEFNLDGGVPRR